MVPTYHRLPTAIWLKRRTEELANAIVERPEWKVLVFPLIPLGTAPANIAGQTYVFPGSYTVRPATLRAIFMDLASDLGEQGFRWIFIVHLHRGPNHNPHSQRSW